MNVENRSCILAVSGLVFAVGLCCLLPVGLARAADSAGGPAVTPVGAAANSRVPGLPGDTKLKAATGASDAASGSKSGPDTAPLPIVLDQNFPNPFNPFTDVRFELPEPLQVRLDVYNIIGQRVVTLADGWYEPGPHLVRWDGNNSSGTAAASGIYFYRLEAGQQVAMRKMVLLR